MGEDKIEQLEVEPPSFIDRNQILYSPSQITFERRIGKGAFGSVYKARINATGQEIAVKKLYCELLKPGEKETRKNEYQMLHRLSNPYITKYFGLSFKDREQWILMEYCALGSLEHIMEVTGRTLSENQASYIIGSLAKGLAYLHENKVLHRDIKCANLLVNPLGEVKLADFGIARLLEGNLTYSTYGTPHWMAPEIWAESGYDYAADIWSLGITAYECVEGEPPYEDTGPMAVYLQVKQKGAPRFANGEDYSPEFVNFVYACLELDPKKRPTAQQLLSFPFIANGQGKEIISSVISTYMEEVKKLALLAKEEKETASQAEGGASSKHSTRRTTKKLIKTNTKTTTVKSSGTVQIKKGDTTVVHGSNSATMVVHATPAATNPNLSGTVQIKKDPQTPAPVAAPAATTGSASKQTMVIKNATVVKK